MGQYFKAVNLDKREYVCPWCLGGGAKLWEWAANPQGAVFTLLLRRSDARGGGDYFGRGPQVVELPDGDAGAGARALTDAVLEGVFHEGRPVAVPPDLMVGRWAGDRVLLVGDYDSSGLYDEAETFRNISESLAREWNAFIELPEMRLEVRTCSTCQAGPHD